MRQTKQNVFYDQLDLLKEHWGRGWWWFESLELINYWYQSSRLLHYYSKLHSVNTYECNYRSLVKMIGKSGLKWVCNWTVRSYYIHVPVYTTTTTDTHKYRPTHSPYSTHSPIVRCVQCTCYHNDGNSTSCMAQNTQKVCMKSLIYSRVCFGCWLTGGLRFKWCPTLDELANTKKKNRTMFYILCWCRVLYFVLCVLLM